MERILQMLDAQWRDVATGPQARRALIRWANDHEALSGLRDLREVVECRHDPARANEVLQVLVRLAANDELASRTVLQVVLPGIVRVAVDVGRDNPDATDELVALAWERIRTYPPTRSGSVVANVVLDVRKQYLRFQRRSLAIGADVMPERATHLNPEQHVLARLQLEELLDACRRGVVSTPVLDAIVRTRLDGEPLADVAASLGVETEVLCQRRWRAQMRLRALPLAG